MAVSQEQSTRAGTAVTIHEGTWAGGGRAPDRGQGDVGCVQPPDPPLRLGHAKSLHGRVALSAQRVLHRIRTFGAAFARLFLRAAALPRGRSQRVRLTKVGESGFL